jgi:hypothetical protein
MCAFIKFTANCCSKSDSLEGSIDARSTVTAQTGSADTHAASGTFAAESAADTTGGEVNCSRRPVGDAIGVLNISAPSLPEGKRLRFSQVGGNKNCSAGSTRAAHAASLWSAPLTSR